MDSPRVGCGWQITHGRAVRHVDSYQGIDDTNVLLISMSRPPKSASSRTDALLTETRGMPYGQAVRREQSNSPLPVRRRGPDSEHGNTKRVELRHRKHERHGAQPLWPQLRC